MQVYAETVESLKKSLLNPILLTDFVNLLIDNFFTIYSFCFIKWSLPMLTKIKTLKDKIKRHQAAQCKPWRCYSELTSAHRGVALHCWSWLLASLLHAPVWAKTLPVPKHRGTYLLPVIYTTCPHCRCCLQTELASGSTSISLRNVRERTSWEIFSGYFVPVSFNLSQASPLTCSATERTAVSLNVPEAEGQCKLFSSFYFAYLACT